MSEPTLEQIAASDRRFTYGRMLAAVASHLLTTIEQSDEHCHRLDALESASGRPAGSQWVHENDLLAALAERDAAIARADLAEKKLAAAEEATRYEVESTVMVEADLERLRPYIQHLFDCPQGGLIQIVGDPCTCGLTDALAGSGQHA